MLERLFRLEVYFAVCYDNNRKGAVLDTRLPCTRTALKSDRLWLVCKATEIDRFPHLGRSISLCAD